MLPQLSNNAENADADGSDTPECIKVPLPAACYDPQVMCNTVLIRPMEDADCLTIDSFAMSSDLQTLAKLALRDALRLGLYAQHPEYFMFMATW